jgi:hypothetical protein
MLVVLVNSKRERGERADCVYKYELDDGTEIHDPAVPSTTTCPYLPGQPVNLLWVPVEIQLPRDRSASMSSMAIGDLKTLVPTDKFLTPRAPPPVPRKHSRASTAPMEIARTRPARSVSPKPEKLQWSPRTLFGRRSPSSQSQKGERRGQWSPLGRFFGDDASGSPPSPAKLLIERKISLPTARPASTQSLEWPLSREVPLRRAISHEPSSYIPISSPQPAEIEEVEEAEEEDEEDHDNFASHLHRTAHSEESIPTPLSPPSLASRSPRSRPVSSHFSKALPALPPSVEDGAPSSPPLLPVLRFRGDVSAAMHTPPQRSHFSASTAVTSPTASYFDFSDDEDENDDDDDGVISADEVFDSPGADGDPGFRGYRITDASATAPEGHGASKDAAAAAAATAAAALSEVASRRTFGGPSALDGDDNASSRTTLDELRRELGYLGGMIVSK